MGGSLSQNPPPINPAKIDHRFTGALAKGKQFEFTLGLIDILLTRALKQGDNKKEQSKKIDYGFLKCFVEYPSIKESTDVEAVALVTKLKEYLKLGKQKTDKLEINQNLFNNSNSSNDSSSNSTTTTNLNESSTMEVKEQNKIK